MTRMSDNMRKVYKVGSGNKNSTRVNLSPKEFPLGTYVVVSKVKKIEVDEDE